MKRLKTNVRTLAVRYQTVLLKFLGTNVGIILLATSAMAAPLNITTGDNLYNPGSSDQDYDAITMDGGSLTMERYGMKSDSYIDISGGTVSLSNGAELEAQNGAFNISGGTVTATAGTHMFGNTVTISNGTVSLSKDAVFTANGSLTMTGGTLNMNDGFLGVNGTDNGNNHFTAGPINVNGNATINITGGNDNIFLGATTLDNGASLVVSSGAVLSTYNDFTDMTNTPSGLVFGQKGNITVNSGRIDLAGTLNSNVSGTGEVAFKASSAVLDGNVTGAKLSFGASHSLNNAVTGTIGAISALNVNAGTLSYDKAAASIGTVNVAGGATLNIGANTLTTSGTVTFADNSTLAFRVSGKNAGEYGAINANAFNISSSGTNLALTLDNGVLAKGETQTFTILNGSNITSFASLSTNARYEFVDNGNGTFDITGKATAADVVNDSGGSSNTAGAATSWLDGGTHAAGSKAESVANRLNTLSQQADGKALVSALDALAPDAAPIVHAQAQAHNQQLFNVTGARMDSAQQGRSGGDAFQKAGLWAQGLYNKTKLDKKIGFDGDSYGLAIGGDAYLTDDLKVGLGFAYTQSDIDSTGRNTDVDTYSVFAYGQQSFGKLFVNGALTYGWSSYDETKNVGGLKIGADYDANTFGAQAMTGYHFELHQSGVLTPEVGLRYLYATQDSYTDDAGQRVKSDSTDTLTGVLGARYAYTYKAKGLNIIPEVKAAVTYDLIDADSSATVRLANGSAYRIKGESLNRSGMETGVKLGVEVGNIEFALAYEGQFRSDYKDHSGLATFRYNF